LSSGDYVFNLDIDNFICNAIDKIREMNYDSVRCEIIRKGTFGRIGCAKTIFKSAGGYDESFLPAGHHEQDFLARCGALGFSFRHLEPKTMPIPNEKEDTVKNMNLGISWEEMNKENQRKKRMNAIAKITNPNKRHRPGKFVRNFSEIIEMGEEF
jgi:hypothetical protein